MGSLNFYCSSPEIFHYPVKSAAAIILGIIIPAAIRPAGKISMQQRLVEAGEILGIKRLIILSGEGKHLVLKKGTNSLKKEREALMSFFQDFFQEISD